MKIFSNSEKCLRVENYELNQLFILPQTNSSWTDDLLENKDPIYSG